MSGKKRWLFIGVVPPLSFILLYLFLIWPMQKRYKVIYDEVANKTNILRSFFSMPGGPPTKNEIGSLKNEIKILRESYANIEKVFVSGPAEKVDITPVEFGKILYERKRHLIQEAENNGMRIPPDIGFKETIPMAEEVGIMVKELEAVSFVIREAILFRFGDIKGIKYHGVEAEAPWEKVGIELEMSGDFGDIADFLYNLSQSEKICIIKSLEIKRGAEKGSKPKAAALKSGIPVVKAGVPATKPEVPAVKPELPLEKSDITAGERDSVEVLVRLECYNYIPYHGD